MKRNKNLFLPAILVLCAFLLVRHTRSANSELLITPFPQSVSYSHLPLVLITEKTPRIPRVLRNYYMENPVILDDLGCTIGQYAAGDTRAQSYLIWASDIKWYFGEP